MLMNNSFNSFSPSDESSRRTILQSLSQNIFVEAGAGTGKTTILVGRIVNLIESGLATIDSIAAITFTNSAAEELRIRIREKLDLSSEDQSKTTIQRDRASQGVRDIDKATISTLHGFASSILRLKPLEAGLPPGFAIMDSVQTKLMFRKQFLEWRDNAINDPNLEEYWLTYFSYGLEIHHIEKLAFDLMEKFHLLDQSTNFLFDDRLPEDSASVFINKIQSDLAGVLGNSLNQDDKLFFIVNRFKNSLDTIVLQNDEISNLINLIACIDDFRSQMGNLGSKTNWNNSPKSIRDSVKDSIDPIKQQAIESIAVIRFIDIKPLFESISKFVIDSAQQRKILGRVGFSDLLLWARNLLRDDLEVRDYFRSKFSHLLIDEFQDTDPIQVEIAFFIAEENARENLTRPNSWKDIEPVSGKLFFVGDPQQSIYKFRNADIETLSEVQSEMGIIPFKLSQNFRSQKPILDWVNYGFGRLIGQAKDLDLSLSSAYSPLSHRGEISKPGGVNSSVWYLGDPQIQDSNIPTIRENEAIEVCRLLSGLKSTKFWIRDLKIPGEIRHAKFSDVVILIQQRTGINVLENMLEDQGIPYRVEGGALILNTQEVQDLINCLKAIDDPSDEVAIVAALRSPGFACSDEDLLAFKNNGGEFNYLESKLLKNSIVEDSLSELKEFHVMKMWVSTSEFLKRFVKKRCFLDIGLAAKNRSEFWRRVEFLIGQSEIFEKAGGSGLNGFLEWIEVLKEDRENISSPLADQQDDGFVRIMTVHASKGLEFPIVILTGLYNLNRKNQGSRNPSSVWAFADKSIAKVQFRIGNSESFLTSTGFEELQRIDFLKDHFETFRRLYVASTRARDHLILSIFSKNPKDSLAMQITHAFNDCDEGLYWQHFEGFESQIFAKEVENITIDQNNLLRDRDNWIRNRETILRTASDPNYLSATSISKADEKIQDDQVFFESKTDGTEIGRAVHSVLEEIDFKSRENLSVICNLIAKREGILNRSDEIEELVLSACNSRVVERAIKSGNFMKEVPFSVPIPSSNLPERTMEGYIDLLFEEEDGLVVVDYKTDTISQNNIQEVLSRYRFQGAAYALGVEKAISKPVKEVVFLFLRSNREEKIVDLETGINELKSSIKFVADEG